MAPKRKPKDESEPPKPTDQELDRLDAAIRGSGPGTSSGPDRGRGNGPARGKQASTFNLHAANGCEYLPTELKLPADLDWEKWQELFHSIISNSKSSPWRIGDALVFASKERTWGDKCPKFEKEQNHLAYETFGATTRWWRQGSVRHSGMTN